MLRVYSYEDTDKSALHFYPFPEEEGERVKYVMAVMSKLLANALAANALHWLFRTF